tara:strand:+ start:2795 stop:3529 length:735 start_codon:yes stop_codon:yes gene_type:complete
MQSMQTTSSPFPDEQAAINAYLENPNNLNATILAMTQHKYAQTFYAQFKEDKSTDTLRISLEYLERATEIAPNSPSILKLRAAIFYDQRAIIDFRTEALSALEAYLAVAPDDLVYQILYVDFLMELGMWRSAAKASETAYTANPAFAQDTLLDRMVANYLSAGWPHRGIGFFDDQLKNSPSNPGLLLSKAILQRRVSDTIGARLSLGAVLLNRNANNQQKETARKLRDHWSKAAPLDDTSQWPG